MRKIYSGINVARFFIEGDEMDIQDPWFFISEDIIEEEFNSEVLDEEFPLTLEEGIEHD